MQLSALCLLSVIVAVSAGCALRLGGLERRERVSYYDRNGDGKIDREKHEHPGVADADWELRDDDGNGRYEEKVLFGVGVMKSAVDFPVPTGFPGAPGRGAIVTKTRG